jgi:hypothetical protein
MIRAPQGTEKRKHGHAFVPGVQFYLTAPLLQKAQTYLHIISKEASYTRKCMDFTHESKNKRLTAREIVVPKCTHEKSRRQSRWPLPQVSAHSNSRVETDICGMCTWIHGTRAHVLMRPGVDYICRWTGKSRARLVYVSGTEPEIVK